MEDRGVSPRGQAVDGDRGLPVPGFSHPAQPHSVRITGVESSEGSGLPNRADHLPDQARLAARLPRPTTQESHGSNGSCVSPNSDNDGHHSIAECFESCRSHSVYSTRQPARLASTQDEIRDSSVQASDNSENGDSPHGCLNTHQRIHQRNTIRSVPKPNVFDTGHKKNLN